MSTSGCPLLIAYKYIQSYIYTCTCNENSYIHVHSYVHIYMYIHMYIYTCTYIYVHSVVLIHFKFEFKTKGFPL